MTSLFRKGCGMGPCAPSYRLRTAEIHGIPRNAAAFAADKPGTRREPLSLHPAAVFLDAAEMFIAPAILAALAGLIAVSSQKKPPVLNYSYCAAEITGMLR